MPVNCWGPSVGGRAVSYKTAIILGLVGQAVGILAFGPESFRPYGDLLDHRQQLPSHPAETMYALMWSLIVPLVWQIAAVQQKMILPMYLGPGKCLHAWHQAW